MPGLPHINRLLAAIDENPIEGAKAAQKRYRDGVRNATYESSVSAGALYRKLKGSKALQSAFYSLPFWEGGNARDPKHLNKHCHQFVYGAREGSEASALRTTPSPLRATTTTSPGLSTIFLKR